MHIEPSHSPVGLPSLQATAGVAGSTRIYPQFEEEYCSPEFLDGVLEHRFSFNGETHQLGRCIDWLTNPAQDIEWHILLHKFYFAAGLAREYQRSHDTRYTDCFMNMAKSWIDQVEPGYIATDVTGRRVQNWIYAWYLFQQDGSSPFDDRFEQAFMTSIVEQVEYIREHMAPARNHRTLELYAVFLAAIAFPDLDEFGRWLEHAVAEMVDNIGSDLLPDGVHCELASDYHHIVLRSYLLFYQLAKINRVSLPPEVGTALCRALEFSLWVHRPDGLIPALSDSDSRSYLYLLGWGADMFDRPDFAFAASRGCEGEPPRETSRIFTASGYAMLRSAWEAGRFFHDARHLVFDCGPIGAGNHGHLDALSVEISGCGRPLIVDPGRYSYDEQEPNWRARFRRTAAHNTVTVDGMDQAIYLQNGSRKKIHEPHPVTRLIEVDTARHIPYLHGRVDSPNYDAVHDRRIWFPRSQYWVIVDSLTAIESHCYDLSFQLTPDAENAVKIIDHDGVTEVLSPGLQMICLAPVEQVFVDDSFVSVDYGIKKQAPLVRIRKHCVSYDFMTIIRPVSDEPTAITVDRNDRSATVSFLSGVHTDAWEWCTEERTLSMLLPRWKNTWFCGGSERAHH